MECDRKTLLVSFGGGAVADLAGFVAATYLRGIELVHIPTTLLAMVDATIGGKCGINLQGLKNRIGAFHPAQHVLIDPELLHTLPDREFWSGTAEIIKVALACDGTFFQELEVSIDQLRSDPALLSKVIDRSVALKEAIVREDLTDHGQRAVLNLGHTFAHAIESEGTWLHGEAVALGLCWAAQLSHQMGLLSEGEVERIRAICTRAQLPTQLPPLKGRWLRQMRTDKKWYGKQPRLVLPLEIGRAELQDVAWTAIEGGTEMEQTVSPQEETVCSVT